MPGHRFLHPPELHIPQRSAEAEVKYTIGAVIKKRNLNAFNQLLTFLPGQKSALAEAGNFRYNTKQYETINPRHAV